MRTDGGRNAAVEVPRQRLLLAGGFTVQVDKDALRRAEHLQLFFDRLERIFEVTHEDAALDLDDTELAPAFELEQVTATAGSLWVVRRPNELRLSVEVLVDRFEVPDV